MIFKMENNENTGLNFEELHKEGLERRYYKKNGYGITKPFSYVAYHLYELASVAKTEMLASFVMVIPFIVMAILVLVNGYEYIYKGVPSYITIAAEILGIIFFFSITVRKMEIERGLSLANQSFDKAYKHSKIAFGVDVASSMATSNYKRTGDAFSGAMGVVGTGIELYFRIKILYETIDGVRKQLKTANKDFSDKAFNIKEAHGNMLIFTIIIAFITIAGTIATMYGYATIAKSTDALPIILGIGMLTMCLIPIPNTIFQNKYIEFLNEAADLLIQAEKVSVEDLEKLELEEKENKKK